MVDFKPACRGFFAAAVCAGLTGTAAAAEPGTVSVYDATQVAFGRYIVVKRVGIDGWRSAFRIKGQADLAAATQAVLNEAQRVGADGVVNLTCFDQTDGLFDAAGYFCYGNAIRLQK